MMMHCMHKVMWNINDFIPPLKLGNILREIYTVHALSSISTYLTFIHNLSDLLSKSTGAVSLQCDEQSGLCICKPGVKGASCNTCQEQHFGFSQTGCRYVQQCMIYLSNIDD